ncbi:MFS transporter [Lentzea sp. NPDC058450]|uniref:MFS transporter n=1 Tax=Lentzea sp. NPDC058450 TaxID=3346505 RepID=UPI00365BC43C
MLQLSRYAPPTRNGAILAVSALVDSIGTGLFLAIVPVFVVLHLGADPVKVGVVVGAANLIALLSPLPAGWLTDRLGPGPVWTGLLVGRAIGYSAFLFVSSFTGYAVLLCVLGLFDRASAPVQQVFLLRMERPEDRSRSMAVLRTARNVGMSVGLLLGGLVISIGTRTAFTVGFGVNALSFVVLLVAVRMISRTSAPVEPEPVQEEARAAAGGVVLKDRRYLTLAAGNAILLLHDAVLFTLLPLWVISKTELAPGWIGPLLAVNTVLTVALQVPLTKWSNTIPKARRTILRSLVPLLVAVVLFLTAEHVGAAVVLPLTALAVVLLTLGENMHSVSAFELSYRMAPEKSMGSYLGAFDFGHAAQLAVGPPFMTVVVLRGAIGWSALGGAFVLGAVLMAASAATRRRPAGD